MIRLIIADDHVMFRESLSERLKSESDIQVVGDCGNAREAVRLAAERQADVLLIDVEMPGNPFQAAREIVHAGLQTRLIACSPYCADSIVDRCLQAGMHGIILKTQGTDSLLQAIRAVKAGSTYFAEEVRSRLSAADRRPVADAAQGRTPQLTPRELEVIRLLAQGQSLKQVAQSLYVSYKTVDSHTYNLMRKLGLRNRAELVHYAIREKVVSIASLGAESEPAHPAPIDQPRDPARN